MDDIGIRPPLTVIDAARSGDTAALEVLLRNAWPHAFRLALVILKDRALAEDAAQEASINAGLNISALRESAAFTKWFVRIAVREAIRLSKSAGRAELSLCESEQTDDAVPSEMLDLRRSILALPNALRVPLVLATYGGLSSMEIGDILSLRAGAVRFRVWRAKSILREKLRSLAV